MDFELSDEMKLFTETVRDWVDREDSQELCTRA